MECHLEKSIKLNCAFFLALIFAILLSFQKIFGVSHVGMWGECFFALVMACENW